MRGDAEPAPRKEIPRDQQTVENGTISSAGYHSVKEADQWQSRRKHHRC
jgi:hypothetical protein